MTLRRPELDSLVLKLAGSFDRYELNGLWRRFTFVSVTGLLL